MALAAPKLDDRQFQDIVDEARKRIPHYCPEWTDHNVSDPGVTLIELFAWMTDIILYQLNQVPDLHYIKLMEMLGVTLRPPVPAKVPVTFWLSHPQDTPIPAGTEVASTQTETEPSIVFTTDVDFRVKPPQLKAVISEVTSTGGQKTHQKYDLRRLQAGLKSIEVFSAVPQADDALHFGFENDLSHHILGFEMDLETKEGAGVNPEMPPYVWEALTEEAGWQPCEVEIDTTRGMDQAGRVQIHLPKLGKSSHKDRELCWVRVRNKQISEDEERNGMTPYKKSPVLRRVSVASWGGTVPATHAQQITDEELGHSDGSPDQRFQLSSTPILARRFPDETLLVQVDGRKPQAWKEVPDFSNSEEDDCHYTLDRISGELRLGPAVRQQDGNVKSYGAIPPRAATLIFKRYRYGGGQKGNVAAGVLNTLKTGIPYIARVSNQEQAQRGLDAETLESAMLRVPAKLRTQGRAVTAKDFEYLAENAPDVEIGRAKCLQPRLPQAGDVPPVQVHLLVIPRVPHPQGFLKPDQLDLNGEDVAHLKAYLDDRRLLTTRLDIRPPAYYWVAVEVELRAAPGVDPAETEAEVLARLYRFLNPLTGGPGGNGWPFGRDLFVSDVYQCLQGIPDVQFIQRVNMCPAHRGGRARREPLEVLKVSKDGVIVSGLHSVKFV